MISIVVPCHNEEAAIPHLYRAVEEVAEQLDCPITYLFVEDGSTDQTLSVIKDLARQDSRVSYLSFSRNFGKEAALFAGLKAAKGSLVAIMDADLQDPPALLLEMKALLDQDASLDCVGTKRMDRTGEPILRSFLAQRFYTLLNRMSSLQLEPGVRDFRLMRRPMVDAILEVAEYNRFSKGIFAWVGFRTTYLPYHNVERIAGKTSWSFWSLLAYSIEGIVNFSDLPLQLASYLGFVSFLLSLVGMLVVITKTLVFGEPVLGWPSMVCILLCLGGLQLMTIGILGKYLAKVFLETKKRPLYIIKEQKN